MRKRYKNNGDNVGLLTTIIFHLIVVIGLLSYKIVQQESAEHTFIIDFSKQEELEKELEEKIFKEDISKKVEEMLAAARQSQEPIRNIAVDAGSQLKDNMNTDVDELYKEMERIAAEVKENQMQDDFGDVDMGSPGQEAKEDKTPKKEYSGPSVVSYSLDGRKATFLKVPAYKCYGSGDVTVIITVDPSGSVIDAEVLDAVSSGDRCLRNKSIDAAKESRFTASTTAEKKQIGQIVYRFIAQ